MDQRRDHILGAALQCFEERGLTKASVDDICIAAKVSKGGFYTYFKSKDELILRLMENRNFFSTHIKGESVEALGDSIFDHLIAPAWGNTKGRVELETIAMSALNSQLGDRIIINLRTTYDRIAISLRALEATGSVTLPLTAEAVADILGNFAIGIVTTQIAFPKRSKEDARNEFATLINSLLVE